VSVTGRGNGVGVGGEVGMVWAGGQGAGGDMLSWAGGWW
jgi:hypothetical protein